MIRGHSSAASRAKQLHYQAANQFDSLGYNNPPTRSVSLILKHPPTASSEHPKSSKHGLTGKHSATNSASTWACWWPPPHSPAHTSAPSQTAAIWPCASTQTDAIDARSGPHGSRPPSTAAGPHYWPPAQRSEPPAHSLTTRPTATHGPLSTGSNKSRALPPASTRPSPLIPKMDHRPSTHSAQPQEQTDG